MRLPGEDDAIIPPDKLVEYVLNVDHPHGGPKARVFRAALGIGPANADVLERALRRAACEEEAELLRADEHGEAYRIDFVLKWEGRSATVRSGWIVPSDGSPTRLTTAIVRRRKS